MELYGFYFITIILTIISFIIVNKLNKVGIVEDFKFDAQGVWFMSIIPAFNIIIFILNLCVIVYCSTKDFIEQN